jgi:GDP-L-fucose synthase
MRMSMGDKFILEGKKIWVAGANGMVGSAIVRSLSGFDVDLYATARTDVDLIDSAQVQAFYEEVKPNVVILAAAKVGGIHANATYPVDFISDNLQIQQNVISGAQRNSVKKLLFLGSSCIYPRDCSQPIKEEYLLTSALEPTNEWYAIAKIAGVKLCQAYRKQYGCDFISAMPTNLYGPNDNFHPENSHVPAALLSRFHEAKVRGANSVNVWGTGKPCREFLHVDDLAEACLFLLQNYSGGQHINVGTGSDISISEFSKIIKKIVGFEGGITFETDRPDGTPRKLLDVAKINALGWKSKIELKDGLKQYYRWYLENNNE